MKTLLIVAIALFSIQNLHSKSAVDALKQNGLKVVLDDDESEFNTFMKELMPLYWTFSKHEFIKEKDYQSYSGSEKDFVLSKSTITVTANGAAWCSSASFLFLINKHKHIPKKSNKVEISDFTAYDFIGKEEPKGESLKALLKTLIQQQNTYVLDIYTGSKKKTQAMSYKDLKTNYAKTSQTEIYILAEDVIDKAFLSKSTAKFKVVTEEVLRQAILGNEDILFYDYEDFNKGHSVKKVISAKSGKVYFNITNGKTNDKATFKDVVKSVS